MAGAEAAGVAQILFDFFDLDTDRSRVGNIDERVLRRDFNSCIRAFA